MAAAGRRRVAGPVLTDRKPEAASGRTAKTPSPSVGAQQASDVLAPVKSGRGSQNIMHTPHDLFLETPHPNLTSTARAAGRVNSPPPPKEVGDAPRPHAASWSA